MKKENLFNLLKKYKVKNKDLNYNIFSSGDLDSLQLMNFIIDLEKLTRKKIDPSKLSIVSNQNIGGLIKLLKIK
tara:strand:+ start:39 stop:260 length:222 start_codon:yes stop_codon:yes gene_type:complete